MACPAWFVSMIRFGMEQFKHQRQQGFSLGTDDRLRRFVWSSGMRDHSTHKITLRLQLALTSCSAWRIAGPYATAGRLE
jgi:hypothetical protein